MADKEIVEQWYPLIDLVVNRILQGGYKHLKQHKDDLVSQGVFGLYSGIDTYDPNGGSSEVSWYSRKIKTHVLNYIRDFEDKGGRRDISIDDIQIAIEEEEYVDPDYELIDKYEPEDEVSKEIYHRLLVGDTTNKGLAEELGMSKKSIERRKQRLKAKLRKQMEQDNVLEDRNAN